VLRQEGGNTIYLNVDDLHEELLAHEMAHAIIDHYLLVRPPPATAEILATMFIRIFMIESKHQLFS
jgi:hypothetical protein